MSKTFLIFPVFIVAVSIGTYIFNDRVNSGNFRSFASINTKEEYEYQRNIVFNKIEKDYRKNIKKIFENKCFDCHDSTVNHAPYANIVSKTLGKVLPETFDLVGHKVDGLKKFDYSKGIFGDLEEEETGLGILGALEAVAADEVVMPLESYTNVYRSKKLTSDEKNEIEQFTRDAKLELNQFYEVYGTRFSDVKSQNILTKESQQFLDITNKYCLRCHNNNDRDGGFGLINDLEKLASSKYIDKENPNNSLLLKQIIGGQDASMPPFGEKLSEQDVQIVKEWIVYIAQGGKVIDENAITQVVNNSSNKVQNITKLVEEQIFDDIPNIEQDKLKSTRYVTFTHLMNTHTSDEIENFYIKGFNKLINSLSWKKDLVKLEAVSEEKFVYKIDIRKLGWSSKNWQQIFSQYPYFIVSNKTKGELLSRIFESGEALPYIRGDWFISEASQPPLYHDILQLPETEQELERMLGLNTINNIKNGEVIRAGFYDSGVSQHNRLIERHKIRDGYYWKSYDFDGSDAKKDLLKRPFSPFDSLTKSLTFDHAGGEVIFSLPNGMQAYYLAEADGTRIDRGPTAIVQDIFRKDKTVVNGISCMNCHFQGMKRKDDEIRELADFHNAYQSHTKQVRILYPGNDELNKAYDMDQERFEEASVGLEISTFSQSSEPVFNAVKRYDNSVDLAKAANELGVEVSKIINSQTIEKDIIYRLSRGAVSRKAFEKLFPTLAHDLELIDESYKTYSSAANEFRLIKKPRPVDKEEQKKKVSLCKSELKEFLANESEVFIGLLGKKSSSIIKYCEATQYPEELVACTKGKIPTVEHPMGKFSLCSRSQHPGEFGECYAFITENFSTKSLYACLGSLEPLKMVTCVKDKIDFTSSLSEKESFLYKCYKKFKAN